jgi:hypothetical protein
MDLGGEIDETSHNQVEVPWKEVVGRRRWNDRVRAANQGCGLPLRSGGLCPGFGCKCARDLGLVTKVQDQSISAVSGHGFVGRWQRIPVTVDSGAVDWVTPKTTAPGVELRENRMSREGVKYRAANGSPIENYGQKSLKGYSGDWNPTACTMQVADVRETLGSVDQMVEGDNLVVFGKPEFGGSYIQDMRTGRRTDMRRRNGKFQFDLWIEGQKSVKSVTAATVTSNQFAELTEKEVEGDDVHRGEGQGFPWLEDPL